MKTTIVLLLLLLTWKGLAQLTPQEAVAAMKKGINMGNTLEPPREGDWQAPAKESYFNHYKAAGFDLVRIPVRWDKHTDTQKPYTVDESWMNRVEQVVDWGLAHDLYIVVNAHHDNWIKNDYSAENKERFDSIWSQIALRFKDKSEKLIFEILNEPHGLTEEQNNELHQRILGIIRKSNPTRNVIVQGNGWGSSSNLINMALPEDPYIIGSFHSYDPWPFGLEGTGSFGSASDLQKLDNKFKEVHEWSLENDVPVFLGEFACHRDADYNSWSRHYRAYTDLSEKYGFTPVTWDDGGWFQMLYRTTGKWKDSKDILMHSGLKAPVIESISVVEDTLIRISWSDGSVEAEQVTIEHRDSLGSFSTLVNLGPGSREWVHQNAERGAHHYYRVIYRDAEGKSLYSNPLTIYLPPFEIQRHEWGYFLGYPHPIPGTIEAEDFDLGAEGVAYHENDATNVPGAYRPDEAVDIYKFPDEAFFVGNLFEGEWMKYSVEVTHSGLYSLSLHFSTPSTGSRLILHIGDQSSPEIVLHSTGSWTTLDSISFPMQLEAGEYMLRLEVLAEPGFMIDRFDFSIPTRSAYHGEAEQLPGSIEAEHFDKGGEGIGYHENDFRNLNKAYRPGEAVDIYPMGNGSHSVGHLLEGEWMEYSVDVEREGLYHGKVLVSGTSPGGSFRITIGEQQTAELSVPAGSSWSDVDTLHFELSLVAGEQVLHFEVLKESGFMVDRYDFELNTTGLDPRMQSGISIRQHRSRIILFKENGNSLGRIRLFNLLGSLVLDRNCPSSESELDVSGLPSGAYLIQAISNKSIYQQKIVLNP